MDLLLRIIIQVEAILDSLHTYVLSTNFSNNTTPPPCDTSIWEGLQAFGIIISRRLLVLSLLLRGDFLNNHRHSVHSYLSTPRTTTIVQDTEIRRGEGF